MATSWVSNNDIAPKTKHFGHFLAHNLNYDTLQDIISGDLFTYLWENLGQFDICNQKCKENITDTIVWNADWENIMKR